MRKVGEGINPSVVEDPIQRKYWEIVRGALSEISAGTSKIINNINYPSTPGDPDFNALNYLDLRGRVGGQVLHSKSASGSELTISESSLSSTYTLFGTKFTSSISGLGVILADDGTNSSTISGGASTIITAKNGTNNGVLSISQGFLRKQYNSVDTWTITDGLPSLFAGTNSGIFIEARPYQGAASAGWVIGNRGPTVTVDSGCGGLLASSGISVGNGALASLHVPSAVFDIRNFGTVGTVVSIFQGVTGQTGHLTEWRSPTGTILSSIATDGSFIGGLTPSGATEFTDNLLTIADGANNTRKFKFQAGSITAGNTRTYTVPDYTGWFPAPVDEGAAGQVLTSGGAGVQPTWATPVSGTTFADNVFDVHNSADATKKFVLSLGGATTGKTLTLLSSHTLDRTITVPNVTGTLATLENAQTFSALQTFRPLSTGVALQTLGSVSGIQTFSVTDTGALTCVTFTLFDPISGFTNDFQVPGVAWTQNQAIIIPAISDALATGTMVLANDSGVTFNVNLGAATRLISNTASSGASFSDTTTTTKRLRMVLSGAVGNNVFSLSNTAARTYTLGNDTSTLVGSTGTSSLTGQTASVGATTLYTTTHAGLYRISIYAVLTAVTIPGNLTLTALWTDPQQAQTLTVNRGGSIAYGVVGAIEEGSVLVRATSGTTLQYSTTLTGTATYNVYAVAEVVTNS